MLGQKVSLLNTNSNAFRLKCSHTHTFIYTYMQHATVWLEYQWEYFLFPPPKASEKPRLFFSSSNIMNSIIVLLSLALNTPFPFFSGWNPILYSSLFCPWQKWWSLHHQGIRQSAREKEMKIMRPFQRLSPPQQKLISGEISKGKYF